MARARGGLASLPLPQPVLPSGSLLSTARGVCRLRDLVLPSWPFPRTCQQDARLQIERQAGQRGSWLADTRWLVMASRRGRGSFSMAGLGSRPSSGDTELTLGQSLQQRAPVGSARAVASARPAPAPCALAVRLTPADGAVY